MAKLWIAMMMLLGFLLVAPVIESGTVETQVFQAVGTAEGGGGG